MKNFKSKVPDEILEVLLSEYEKNSTWNKQKMNEISKRTGLSYTKVYKWNWDRRNFDE